MKKWGDLPMTGKLLGEDRIMLPTARKVYEFIVDYKTKYGGCQPSLRQIEGGTGLAMSHVRTLIHKNLVEAGLVEIIKVDKTTVWDIKGASWIPPQ